MQECRKFRNYAYMGVEYLDLTDGWVKNNHTGGSFPNKPITSSHIHRSTVERIWMNRGRYYRKSGQYSQSRPKSTTAMRSI